MIHEPVCMLCVIECSFVEQTLILLQENDTGLQRHSMSGIITDAVGGTRKRCLTWQTCFQSDSVSPKRGPSLHALQRDEAITFPPKAEQVFLQTRRVRKPFPGGLFASLFPVVCSQWTGHYADAQRKDGEMTSSAGRATRVSMYS